MSNLNFYQELKSFSNFNEFTNESLYRDLPSDWSVVITDIKGSTKAITEGRYKDVNTIGAATIIVARKAMKGADFPFVFGGDGATLLIPQKDLEDVCENLGALKTLSFQNHGLELRVGIISMQELRDLGKPIQVGKFEITKGRSVAVLKGDGLSIAEKLIKGDSGKYELKTIVTKAPDLSGLSCRWNPIPSRNGKIISILVSSRQGHKVYDNFMTELNKILPEGLENSNPTNIEQASYKSVGKLFREELRLHTSVLSPFFIFRALEIVLAVLIFNYNLPPLFFNAEKYKNSMRPHSDFRKFDDVLRMVLDCGHDQIAKITNFLKAQHSAGQLFYGTFETDCSLMTCYVDNLGQGGHIHFIDAENGGYAAAAVGLKKQMKESAIS
jgi:hypothetical protein